MSRLNAPATGSPPTRAFLRLAALAAVLWLAGCATLPPGSILPPPARLQVSNLTDYDWRLALTAVPGTSMRPEQVAARATCTLELAGGDYIAEQTMVSSDKAPGLTRRITFHLEAGQTYHWQLATLLSGDSTSTP